MPLTPNLRDVWKHSVQWSNIASFHLNVVRPNTSFVFWSIWGRLVKAESLQTIWEEGWPVANSQHPVMTFRSLHLIVIA